MRQRGFTLIELVIVIVIIGILAAIAIPKFINLRNEASQAACEASGGSLRAAISNYYASRAIHSPAVAQMWPTACTATVLGPYMQNWPDPPTSGTWAGAYSATTGVLNVKGVCPAK